MKASSILTSKLLLISSKLGLKKKRENDLLGDVNFEIALKILTHIRDSGFEKEFFQKLTGFSDKKFKKILQAKHTFSSQDFEILERVMNKPLI